MRGSWQDAVVDEHRVIPHTSLRTWKAVRLLEGSGRSCLLDVVNEFGSEMIHNMSEEPVPIRE